MSKRRVRTLYWGGFTDGKLNCWHNMEGHPEVAVYKTRERGRQFYDDVRRIKITEVRKP